MAQKFSTGLRNQMLGKVPTVYGASIAVSSRIAAVNGSPDNFTDSGNGFVTAGFAIADTIMVSGFATAANNGIFTIQTVAAGKIEIDETTVVDEAAGALNIKIQVIKGGSLKDIFKDCVLKIYSGGQPTDADQAVTGTLLLQFTIDAAAFVAGSPENGLEFDTAASGAISKKTDAWQAVGLVDGTAGWFRICANAADAGSLSTTLPRIDGICATSGGQLTMSTTAVRAGVTVTIDTFTITMPGA
jgi:hypothetical protein